jgi:hypothetical protein
MFIQTQEIKVILVLLYFHLGYDVSAGLVVSWVLLQLIFQFVPKRKNNKVISVPRGFKDMRHLGLILSQTPRGQLQASRLCTEDQSCDKALQG